MDGWDWVWLGVGDVTGCGWMGKMVKPIFGMSPIIFGCNVEE